MSVLALMEDGDVGQQTLSLARVWGHVHTVRMDAVAPFAPDALAAVLQRAADDLDARAVFAAGTARGNDVMARLAARTGLPFAANVVAADPSGSVTRQRWGGSLLESAQMPPNRLLMTVAPYAIRATDGPAPTAVDITRYMDELDPRDRVVQVKEHIDPPGGGVSLAEAKVVVSGGRGVGSKEGFAIIEELAGLLGGRVGCSRVVTSAGWRPHTDQVGQTGTKISPEIYIACGISGATQHMAGCKGAKKILAINADPEAPIMSLADYSVVGDLKEVVPAISAEIRNHR